jgi:hypothetical protein
MFFIASTDSKTAKVHKPKGARNFGIIKFLKTKGASLAFRR